MPSAVSISGNRTPALGAGDGLDCRKRVRQLRLAGSRPAGTGWEKLSSADFGQRALLPVRQPQPAFDLGSQNPILSRRILAAHQAIFYQLFP